MQGQHKIRRSNQFYEGDVFKISQMPDEELKKMSIKEREALHIQDKEDEEKLSRLFYYDTPIPDNGIIEASAPLHVLRDKYIQNTKDIEAFDKQNDKEDDTEKEFTTVEDAEDFILSLKLSEENLSTSLRKTIEHYQKKGKGENTEEKTMEITRRYITEKK